MKIILGFAGEIGSGKGTVTKYITEKYQANYYRFSDVLRKILDYLHLEKSRDNLQDISTMLRQRFGQDLLTKIVFENVKADTHSLIVIDGIRLESDVEYLSSLPGFKFIFIEADPRTRYQRVVARNENPGDAEKTFEEFSADQKDEADSHIKGLRSKADHILKNDGTLEELHQAVDQLVISIQKQ